MNFLSLVQRTATEAGVSGSITTAQNQSGEAQRVINWVQDAWNSIQTIHDDWAWMRSSYIQGWAGDPSQGSGMSFQSVGAVTPPAPAVYPLGTGAGTCGVLTANFQKWVRGSFYTYPTTEGYIAETPLDLIDFDVWRNTYMLGANRNVQTRPVTIAIGPDMSICLGPPPAAGYTITGDYYQAPSQMSADTDTPIGLPAAQQMIIVWKALLDYAGYEAAPEVMQRAERHYDSMMSQLEILRLPEVGFAGALC